MGLKAFYNSQPSSARCGSGPQHNLVKIVKIRFVAPLFDSSLQNLFCFYLFLTFFYTALAQHYMSSMQHNLETLV